MTLKQRVKDAFTTAGLAWPADDTLAIPLGGAALQCQTDHEVALICDVVRDKPEVMRRNAQLMVLVCTAAGWPEPECDAWIAQELRAGVKEARKSVKRVGALRFTLVIDHPPRLISFHVQETA